MLILQNSQERGLVRLSLESLFSFRLGNKNSILQLEPFNFAFLFKHAMVLINSKKFCTTSSVSVFATAYPKV